MSGDLELIYRIFKNVFLKKKKKKGKSQRYTIKSEWRERKDSGKIAEWESVSLHDNNCIGRICLMGLFLLWSLLKVFQQLQEVLGSKLWLISLNLISYHIRSQFHSPQPCGRQLAFVPPAVSIQQKKAKVDEKQLVLQTSVMLTLIADCCFWSEVQGVSSHCCILQSFPLLLKVIS